MSTSDVMNAAQRNLALFAYDLKRKYAQTQGLSKRQFMALYDLGEVQLSSVYENLLVEGRCQSGKPTQRASGAGFDFVKVSKNGRKTPLGDMKTGTLQKNGPYRRYTVARCGNKQGHVYFIGWNWITNKADFWAIPPKVKLPSTLTVLGVDPETGSPIDGKYGRYYCQSWDEMINKG